MGACGIAWSTRQGLMPRAGRYSERLSTRGLGGFRWVCIGRGNFAPWTGKAEFLVRRQLTSRSWSMLGASTLCKSLRVLLCSISYSGPKSEVL